MSTAIVKADEVTVLDTARGLWTPERIALVKRQVAPKGCSDDDFAVFLAKCQRTGMDPLTGEALLVPRNVKISKKGEPDKWTTLHVFQTTADGMRARAARFPDFVSVDSAAVHANDAVADVNQGTGEVNHKFSAIKPRGTFMGAWGRVTKRDGTKVVVWLPAGSRSGTGQFWSSDPGGMTAKCAEVAALRKAYPTAFENVHAREEVGGDDVVPSRSEVVTGALARVEENAVPPAPPVPALPATTVVEFGDLKGRPVEALTLEEVTSTIAQGRDQIAKHPGAKWVGRMEKNLTALEERREALASALPPDPNEPTDAEFTPAEPQEREPGSDG